MSEKEAKEMLYTLVANNCRGNDEYLGSYEQAFDIIIDLLEQKDNRIYELEKALIDEDLKYRNKIKQYEEQNKEYLNAIKSILLNIPNNEIEISNKDIVQAEKYYVVAKRNVMNNSQKLCLYKGGV